MLLVIGTQSAIVRAAIFGPALELERQVAWLEEILATFEVGRVRRDQCFLRAVFAATFQIIDIVPFDHDFRGHEFQARFAQRRRLAVESYTFWMAG